MVVMCQIKGFTGDSWRRLLYSINWKKLNEQKTHPKKKICKDGQYMCGFTYLHKEDLNQCAYNELYYYDCVHMLQSRYRINMYEDIQDIRINMTVKKNN